MVQNTAKLVGAMVENMAMRHAHEAIVIASKNDEYNGEIISSKEQNKLPQIDYRIKRAIKIGELLDGVVGNTPYRAYGVVVASYRLLCCNLNQRINEIDEDKKRKEIIGNRLDSRQAQLDAIKNECQELDNDDAKKKTDFMEFALNFIDNLGSNSYP